MHARLLVLVQGRPGRPTPARCGNKAPASPQGSNYRTRLRRERPDMRARERGERKQVRTPTEHEDLELRRRLLGRQGGQRFAPRRGPNQPGALRCTDAWRRRTAERNVVIRGEHPLAGCRMDGPARCTVVTDRKREFRLIANFRRPLRDPEEYDNQTCNDFGWLTPKSLRKHHDHDQAISRGGGRRRTVLSCIQRCHPRRVLDPGRTADGG